MKLLHERIMEQGLTPELRDEVQLAVDKLPREVRDTFQVVGRNAGILVCDCPCHKTIEQGGASAGNCIHCSKIGQDFVEEVHQRG